MRRRLAFLTLDLVLLGTLIACSCGLPALLASTTTPTPTRAAIVTPPPVSGCSPAVALEAARAAIPYDEFAASYVHGSDIGTSLAVWFVNPALSETGDSLDDRIALAEQASESLVSELQAQVDCLTQAFDVVETIEVDSSYTGWLSAAYSDLQTTPTQQMNYLIDQEPTPLGEIPAGACSWQDARAEAESVSVPDSNRAVYLVRDRAGTNVYVFWSRPDDLQMDESIYYTLVAMDMPLRFGCLYPPADVLWLIMEDQNGNILQSQQITGAELRAQP
jgi:hypothetical protein